MKKFVIGEQYWSKQRSGETSIEELVRSYKELQQEIRDKLGINDGFLPLWTPYEVIEGDDGEFYLKCSGDSYYTSLSNWRGDVPKPKDGEVMCPCGNKTFYIEYGNYECYGVCTKCGKRYLLYDG